MLEIRRLELGEGPLYRRARMQALMDSPEAFGTSIQEAESRSPESWSEQADRSAKGRERATFIALREEEIIGLGAIYQVAGEPSLGDLIQMWVTPNERGKDTAFQLLHALLEWAGTNQYQKIRAEVFPTNLRAICFYRRNEFLNSESSPTFGSSNLVLTKDLDDGLLSK